jgi:hypothetical protein
MAKRVGGVRGDWKVRVRAVGFKQTTLVDGIHCHEHDVGPPSKWVFSFTAQGVMPGY